MLIEPPTAWLNSAYRLTQFVKVTFQSRLMNAFFERILIVNGCIWSQYLTSSFMTILIGMRGEMKIIFPYIVI